MDLQLYQSTVYMSVSLSIFHENVTFYQFMFNTLILSNIIQFMNEKSLLSIINPHATLFFIPGTLNVYASDG